jgi:cation diffusion facilitator CzcD-associated flavoprotein CzcO
VLSVAIIGSGFGGLGMGIALKQAGIDSFEILEKAAALGGTWRDNTYPGAACDIPSHLYSYSFEIKPDWSRMYAEQPEILRYLEHCATKYGVLPHIRFREEVTQASWNEADACWELRTASGRSRRARTLVAATGQLNRPAWPKIDGLRSFAGPLFHSADWDHSVDLSDKRVSVIGTGASAVQFVPPVAEKAQTLGLFQRSPPYILPKWDRAYSAIAKRLFERVPITQTLHRTGMYLWGEARFVGLESDGLPNRLLEAVTLRHLEKSVADPSLRAALTPDYPPGCKRILISNDYYPALCRPNVKLVTEPIVRMTPRGVETRDAGVHPADVVILGTGFTSTQFLAPIAIHGKRDFLADRWKAGAEAYLGLTVSGFPNFFMLYGPNTNLGHNSILVMLEAQIGYVIEALALMKKAGVRSLDVKPHVFSSFQKEVSRRVAEQVWQGACTSWYKNEAGRNTNNWVGLTLEYRWRTRRPVLEQYDAAE